MYSSLVIEWKLSTNGWIMAITPFISFLTYYSKLDPFNGLATNIIPFNPVRPAWVSIYLKTNPPREYATKYNSLFAWTFVI